MESPLDAVPRDSRTPFAFAAGLAVLVHALAAAGALAYAAIPRAAVAIEQLIAAELIEVPPEAPPPAEPAKAEPPPPEPEPAPRKAHVPREPVPEAAPAPAQAAQTLTQAPKDEVLDFGDTLVQGKSTSYAGGVTEASGSSASAVRDGAARPGGVPGGQGTDTSGVDRSRPPALAGGAQWDCPFPEEADLDAIDAALVTLRVRVAVDGEVEDVAVVKDPGSGFGREARRCALRKRWQPGLDRAGRALAMSSLVNVRFYR